MFWEIIIAGSERHDVGIVKKVKESRYRPGVAQRVPGNEGSQIT
jgi:hypothetical protein